MGETFPVFSRKPLFGYRAFVLATIFIGAYSMTVWAHHMFTTGAINLPFFSATSFIIAVPTGVKFFNWIFTMIGGKLWFPAPMLWSVGFLFTFLFGGITGVLVASAPIDFQFQDTYFVVAHLHNVLVGGSIFAMWAGITFWFPKITGRRLNEPLAKTQFWLWTIGFVVTFLPQYQLGAWGMPRRYADYPDEPGWAALNLVSTVGAFLIALSVVVFLVAVVEALRRPRDAGPDPWEGNSLEWWADSPPGHHNFRTLPPVRSERPVFDARVAAREAERAAAAEAGLPGTPGART
jgi:cytochrome c oxidase subunit 1